jgi:hypothetical protein
MEDNIVNEIVAEANVPDVTLPTYEELVAELQTAKTLHANTLTREKLLQEKLSQARAATFEDKLQAMIEEMVQEELRMLDVDDQIEQYMQNNLDEAVEDVVRNMSFSISVDR